MINSFRILSALGVMAVLAVLPSGCYYDNEEYLYGAGACDTTLVSFSQRIDPLVRGRCFPCHDAASANGGVVMEGFDAVQAAATGGILLCAVRHESGCSPMPKNAPKLSACDIRAIEKWIDNGTPND